MCQQFELFDHLSHDQKIHSICLHDGSLKRICQIGDIKPRKDITLKNALYMPGFQYNLLTVGKLAKDDGVQVIFYDTYCCLQVQRSNCCLQVQRSKAIKAVAWLVDGLC